MAGEEERKSSHGDDSDSDSDAGLHPLFWTKVPNTDEAKEMTESLTNMIYENKTPLELTRDFKESGNEAYGRGRKFFTHALKYYNEAVDWSKKCDESQIESVYLRASILSNISAIETANKNYRSVIANTEEALGCIKILKASGNSEWDVLFEYKVLFRLAKARFELGKLKQALVAATEALEEIKRHQIDPKSVEKLLNTIKEAIEKKKRQELFEMKRKAKEKKEEIDVRRLLQLRDIRLGPLNFDVSSYMGHEKASKLVLPKIENTQVDEKQIILLAKITPKLVHEVDFNTAELKTLIWPLLILYPETGQTDFIESVSELSSFRTALESVLPLNGGDLERVPPWDDENRYSLDQVEIFYEPECITAYDMTKSLILQSAKSKGKVTSGELSKSYTKALKKVSLGDALLSLVSKKDYVTPGIPVVSVVSTASPFL